MTPLARDRYPSRQTSEVTLIERPDPVVHGTAEDGPLTAAQLEEFEEKGFLLLEDVFDADEVRSMLDELPLLAADSTIRESGRAVIEPESDEIRSVFDVHVVSELLKDVTSEPRIADATRQLLGSDVYLHQSRINLKPGFAGKEFYWHSDFETWHVEDGMPAPRAVSASIMLTDNGMQNGPLMIMPGSHHTFVTTVGETPEEHYRTSLRKQEIGVPDEKSLAMLTERHGIEALTALAGSVLLFDSNCMHGSNSNITPYPRSNVFAVYNSVENTLEEPFGGTDPRPEFIAARDFSPLPRR